MNWYYLDSASAPQGPVQPDALRSLVASGQLAASALVWRDGLSAWLPVEQALRDDAAAALRPSAPDDRPPSPEERSFVDDDGTAYQWSGAERRFLPVASGVEPPPLYDAAQQVMPDDAEPPLPLPPPRRADADGEEEEEEAPARRGGGAGPPASGGGAGHPASGGQKRQREEAVAKEREKLAQRKERAAAPRAEGTKVNTSVYVTGIPDGATEAEVAAVFSKCGLLKEGDGGAPRVKLYADKATGVLKGDALVVYLKEPSVGLACAILDGAQLRPGEGQAMTVVAATFAPKPAGAAAAAATGDGAAPPAAGGGGKGTGAPPKKRAKTGGGGGGGGGGGFASGADKALGWDGFDDVAPPKQVVLVLRGLFSPGELDDLPGAPAGAAADALRDDVVAECAKFGSVASARVFPSHKDGVATVKFRVPAEADACRLKTHGRWFGGRQVSAAMYDGREDFGAPAGSGRRGGRERGEETEAEQAARLERYTRELEEGGEGGGA